MCALSRSTTNIHKQFHLACFNFTCAPKIWHCKSDACSKSGAIRFFLHSLMYVTCFSWNFYPFWCDISILGRWGGGGGHLQVLKKIYRPCVIFKVLGPPCSRFSFLHHDLGPRWLRWHHLSGLGPQGLKFEPPHVENNLDTTTFRPAPMDKITIVSLTP